MTNALLISGAGLPAWIWDDVLRGLPAGLTGAVAPRDPRPGATVADHSAAALAAAPAGRFLVVAHSAGGLIAQELVRRAPERVAGVLAVSATLPRPGRSFVGSMPLPNRIVLSVLLRVAGTRPPESMIRTGLGAGLRADVVDRIVADFATESRALFTDRAGRPPADPPPYGYLLTTDDKELPPALQRTFADRAGAGWRRELATGHLPMLQDPAGTAAAVAGFAEVLVN